MVWLIDNFLNPTKILRFVLYILLAFIMSILIYFFIGGAYPEIILDTILGLSISYLIIFYYIEMKIKKGKLQMENSK